MSDDPQFFTRELPRSEPGKRLTYTVTFLDQETTDSMMCAWAFSAGQRRPYRLEDDFQELARIAAALDLK